MNFKIRRMKVKIKRQKCKLTVAKLSNMSINSGLDLKTGLFLREKELYNKSEISSIQMQCSLKCGVVFYFANDNF